MTRRQQRRSSCLISEGCNEDHQRFWKFKSWICSSWPGRPSLIEYHPTPFKTRSYQIGSWDSLESWPDMWFMIFFIVSLYLASVRGMYFPRSNDNSQRNLLMPFQWNKIVMSFESRTCATQHRDIWVRFDRWNFQITQPTEPSKTNKPSVL